MQIGEVLGSIKTLMLFRDDIRINQRQCCLLVDAYTMAFEGITEEIRHSLRFEEKHTKWNALENPLKELRRVIKEGKHYIKLCLEPKDWWAKAISLSQNIDCVGFHIHNLLSCISIVIEAVEIAAEISGCDDEVVNKKRLIFSKKYEREWMDPKLFQIKFGRHCLVTRDICRRLNGVVKEDRWNLSEAVSERRSSLTKYESQLAELITSPKGKFFTASILVGSKDYLVKRRLGSGSQYKEIHWMGESFVLRHFRGDLEAVMQDVSLLSPVSHPNVMHYMYAFLDEEKKECFLVMELMSKDLASYIKEICCTRRRIPFPLIVAVDIMLQIARGMEHLHSQRIYHGDLNPSNVFVRTRSSSPDGYLHVKVRRFNLPSGKNSKVATDDPSIWYAPEVLMEQEQTVVSGRKYTEKADVYSFGMICFELLTGKVPFEDEHLHGDKTSRNIRAGERPLFSFLPPKFLISLTKRCWHADPAQRPSFSSLCRVLRYIKKFLIMNMDHTPLDLPCPPVDYFEIEANLSRTFTTWAGREPPQVSEIPFQMFAYRVIEKEKTSVSKEKCLESSSEGTSLTGDDGGCNMIQDDSFTPLPLTRSASHTNLESSTKAINISPSKSDGKTKKQSGNVKCTILMLTWLKNLTNSCSCIHQFNWNDESLQLTQMMLVTV